MRTKLHGRKTSLGLVAAIALVAACHIPTAPEDAAPGPTVLAAIGAPGPRTDASVDYVVRLPSVAEAEAHARAALGRGGRVTRLDGEGRVLRISAPAAALEGLALPAGASAAANARVGLTRPLAAPSNEPLDALFTARAAIGVDALVARVPEADGRNAKVAVMDTGIDFDVDGVSANGKLVGFFDLTGFGALAPAPVPPSAITGDQYAVGGRTLRIPAAVGARVETGGVLDEVAFAKGALAASYDVDGNGKDDDAFAYAVGTNADGKLAVWIDFDGDGVIERDAEELTDFNTSHRTVDARAGKGTRRVPVAVTIKSAGEVQVHSLASSSSHGTQCASIVAGDGIAGGRIHGMAPKAKLVSYLLDPAGQDLYTMDQLVAMFLHAKAEGVDAISISYGFARGDLASARWFADFVDQEIASAGVIVAIAAGNEGPGIASAAADDYVPHTGFAVGGAVTAEVARSVYGWTAVTEDDVIYYSSAGPTEGGRAVPDVVSPLMNFAKRTSVSPFSGTSSATPALVGGLATLVSALKARGAARIDPRLLKLAVQATARPVPGRVALDQGAGLVDVDAALGRYEALAADAFVPDLRAQTAIAGVAGVGEGLVVRGGAPQAATIGLAAINPDAAARLRAAPVALSVTHDGDFLAAPSSVLLTSASGRVAVQFDATKLAQPGVYTDVVTVRRASDGLLLLRVPVVIQVPVSAPSPIGVSLASVDAMLAPQRTWRLPVRVTEATALRFDGVAMAGGGPGTSAGLSAQIVAANGATTDLFSKSITGPVAVIEAQSDELAPGDYEVLVVRTAGATSTFAPDLRVVGAVRAAPVRLAGVAVDAAAATFAARSDDALAWDFAELTVAETRAEATLARGVRSGRDGFLGTLAFGRPVDGVRLTIAQPPVSAAMEPFLAAEVTLSANDRVLDRLWVAAGSGASGGFVSETSLAQEQEAPLDVLAYPNIARWSKVTTTALTLRARAAIDGVAPWSATLPRAAQVAPGVPFVVTIPFAGRTPPEHASGTLTLKSAGTAVAKIPVDLP